MYLQAVMFLWGSVISTCGHGAIVWACTSLWLLSALHIELHHSRCFSGPAYQPRTSLMHFDSCMCICDVYLRCVFAMCICDVYLRCVFAMCICDV